MIGNVVGKANCDASLPANSTEANNTAGVTMSGPVEKDNDDDDDVRQCRVGVAVALTFMAGIYQVTSQW